MKRIEFMKQGFNSWYRMRNRMNRLLENNNKNYRNSRWSFSKSKLKKTSIRKIGSTMKSRHQNLVELRCNSIKCVIIIITSFIKKSY